MTRIFVYGTLKRGCKNHQQLADQVYLGEARTAPGYRLHHLGSYPGMITDPTDTEGVTGEVWFVDNSAEIRLDAFEGVNEGLYRRERVFLLPPFDNGVVDTYLYARDITPYPAIGPTWQEK